MSNRLRLIVEGLFWGNFALIVGFWVYGSSAMLTAGGYSTLLAVARLIGLIAAYLVICQFLMLGRTPWIERAYGLDRLTRIHHTNGTFAFCLLILHPILISIAYAAGANPISQFIEIVLTFHDGLGAFLGWLLFITAVGVSFAIIRLHLKYQTWWVIHLFNYFALLLVFGHQHNLGGDLVTNQVFNAYWYALYIFTFINVVFFRFTKATLDLLYYGYRVERIEPETASTVSIYVKPTRHLAQFARKRIDPGQFMIWRFLDLPFAAEQHPFSVSNKFDGSGFRLTVRQLGDYTNRLHQLRIGSWVLVDGPYGVFTAKRAQSDRVLLIAGGIGITPLRPLAQQLVEQGKDVVLLYSNKAAGDVPLKSELDAIAGLTVHYVMSEDPTWRGDTGFVDADCIARLVPDSQDRDVFLCGPPPMMKSVNAALAQLGHDPARVYYERFSLQ